MPRIAFRVVLALVMIVITGAGFTPSPAHAAGLVPDAKLRECIAHTLAAMNEEYAEGSPAFNAVMESVSEEHLAALSSAQRLSCEDITSLEGIQLIPEPSLTILHINNGNVANLEPLSELTKLTDISLMNNRVTTVAPLAELKAIKSLVIAGNHISDLSGLAEMKSMEKLDFGVNKVEDLTPLAAMTRMNSLSAYNNKIVDLDAIKSLTLLTILDLTDNNITDVSAVAGFSRLYQLDLGGNPIEDLSAVGEVKNLQNLSITNAGIEDISGLAELSEVSHVDLSGNHIQEVSALAGMTSLFSLNLSNNDIVDISGLKDVRPTDELLLHNNRIEDLTPIADTLNCVTEGGGPCVQWSLEGNAIVDISMLDLGYITSVWQEYSQESEEEEYSTLTIANQRVIRELGYGETTTLPELTLAEEDSTNIVWNLGQGTADLDSNTGVVSVESVGYSYVHWNDGRGFFTGFIEADVSMTTMKGGGKAVYEAIDYVFYGMGGLGVLLVLAGIILFFVKIGKARHARRVAEGKITTKEPKPDKPTSSDKPSSSEKKQAKTQAKAVAKDAKEAAKAAKAQQKADKKAAKQ